MAEAVFLRQQHEGRLERDIGGHLGWSKRADANALHKGRILFKVQRKKWRLEQWRFGAVTSVWKLSSLLPHVL